MGADERIRMLREKCRFIRGRSEYPALWRSSMSQRHLTLLIVLRAI